MSAMDWEAQYKAGVFESNTSALATSSKSRRSSRKDRSGALLGSDNEGDNQRLDSDVTMASVSVFTHTVAPVVEEQEEDDTPLSQLCRHWMNERHAPDILPAQEDLLSSLLDHIRRQVIIFTLPSVSLIHTNRSSLKLSNFYAGSHRHQRRNIFGLCSFRWKWRE